MVGSQKILTVSYGTFSCTLEGFEDPFDAMKAIAEYFRDLAAEDRYFGAEPPTPDTEVLARLAEREAARRVEARMERTGLVLRVDNSVAESLGQDAAPEPVARAAEPAATPPEPAPLPALAPTAGSAMPAAVMRPPSVARAAQDEGVVAKLARIRAVVGRSALVPAEEESGHPDLIEREGTPEGALAAGSGFSEAGAVAAAILAEPTPQVVEAQSADTAEAESAGTPEVQPTAGGEMGSFEAAPGRGAAAEAALPAPAAPVHPCVVRLRRAAPEVTFDAEAEANPEAEARAGVEPLAEAGPLAAPPGGAGVLSPEAEAELMAELAALEAALEPAAPLAEGPGMSGDAAEAAVAGLMAALNGAGSLRRSAAVAEASLGRAAPEAPIGAGREDVAADLEDEEVLATVDGRPAPGALGGPAGDPAPAREALVADALASAFAAGRSDDSIAPVEAPPEAVAPEARAEVPAPTEAAARPRHLSGSPVEDEAAVSRLLSRADAQLAEPEASRRREAIAQLRAAVAATEAARRLGEAAPEPQRREDPFRDDLRHVVRPRRPMPSAQRSGAGPAPHPGAQLGGRPERPRPAPLKLVASQRVDLPLPDAAPGVAEPVRPRRVTVEAPLAPHGDVTARGTSFAAFAAEMGAVSLTDILEAAAAYTSFVEGAEDFSRPQIMDRVRQASPAGFSREDGLRSFGTLLRQGTITRVRSGRFQVTGESRFNPARRAG